MPPLGAIIKFVCILGLIGLVVAAVISAAAIIVPVVVLALASWLIYKHLSAKPRYVGRIVKGADEN